MNATVTFIGGSADMTRRVYQAPVPPYLDVAVIAAMYPAFVSQEAADKLPEYRRERYVLRQVGRDVFVAVHEGLAR